MPTLRSLLVLALLAVPLAAAADPSLEPISLGRTYADAMSMPDSHVVLSGLVEFAPSSARVYSADRETLQRLARAWVAGGRKAMITVDGYSESVDIRLAQHRADRIRGYLMKYGVDPTRVVAVGHALDQGRRRIDLSIER